MNVEASTAAQSITQITSPEQLVAAREARGWSMSDVAAKLGMMPRQIDAIEHGRWEALPGAAFVRGAIRAYGKALQLDVAPLLTALGAQSSAPELRPSSSLDSPLPRHGALGFDNGGSGSRIVWILLGVIGVVAIAMYFGRGADFGQVLEPGSGSSAPGRAVDVVPVAPATDAGAAGNATHTSPSASTRTGASDATATRTPSAGADAASGSPSTGSATLTAPGSSATPAPGSATTQAAGVAATPPAASTASQPASTTASGSSTAVGGAGATTDASPATGSGASGSAGAAGASAAAPSNTQAATDAAAPAAADAVVLRFERESWVDVRDANGRVLLMGTQPANSTREISGQKPYSMTIGNATFVRVEHGGRNVDLGAVTQKGVARVRVE